MATLGRRAYAEMYGPTTGDRARRPRVRLDTRHQDPRHRLARRAGRAAGRGVGEEGGEERAAQHEARDVVCERGRLQRERPREMAEVRRK